MGEHLTFLVVFDPFVLANSVSYDTDSNERAALMALKDNCPHRLILDDRLEKLSGLYRRELGQGFQLLRGSLLDLIGEGKLVVRGGPAPTPANLPGMKRQHSAFLRAAISTRPNYLVTCIRQYLESAELISHLAATYDIETLSPQQFSAKLNS